MNNKISEYRDYNVQLQDSAVRQSAFKEGFNTALGLDLTRKFFQWFGGGGPEMPEHYENIEKLLEEKISQTNNTISDAGIMLQLIYDYWETNVLKFKYN